MSRLLRKTGEVKRRRRGGNEIGVDRFDWRGRLIFRGLMAHDRMEGCSLAQLMSAVNARYEIGLEQRIAKRTGPGDDDGSFVRAGYGTAVINIGSWPYGDPNYHVEGDIPERCDVENAALTVRATLAAILTVDVAK